MGAFLTHLFLWLWLGILGFHVTRRILRTDDPWMTFGSAIPVALLCLLGVFFPLARLIGHPQGWIIGSIALLVITVVFYQKRESNGAPSLQDFGFSPFQWGCFMTLLTAANLVMHTRESIGPEDDYWIHFPLISLLNRGEFPPPNPFFDNLSLHGHFGRDYLVAILSWFSGGGETLLSSLWSFNHILSFSAFLLAFGLGRRHGGTAGGFLMSCLLFFGISVGSRVGLMDTYDNNNLLVYCLLLLFVALETTESDKPYWTDGFLCFALGLYGIIYETHLLLFCMVLWVGPLLWRRAEGKLNPRQWLRPLSICALSILFAAFLGGPIQDLAMRATGMIEVKVDHAATYQAQRVQVKFPKQDLFKIMVGPEVYRRLSYVYQGKAFEGLRKTGETAGMNARADFHYAFILGPDVLLMHWLALYLGLPVGFWLLRKKHPEAQVLWVFGLVSFLVPALVDFGPVHEREYFRWEFGAGFGFAGALAGALALWWSAKKTWLRVVVVILAILTTLGGERKVNRTLINIEKMPPESRSRALSLWYPAPRDWLLKSPELRMNEDLLKAARALRKRSKPSDRLLADLDPRAHWDIFQESTVAALAGLRIVGHVSPPPWMPDGIAPFFRTACWTAFWQTGDTRILPFLNSRWLLCELPGSQKLLEGKEHLKKVEEFGRVSLWRYDGELGAKSKLPPEDCRVVDIERPTNRELQGEVALPMTLTLENPPDTDFDLGVTWKPLPGTDPGGPIQPLLVRCKGGEAICRHYLVAPLVEGRYRIEFSVNGHPIPRVNEDAVLEFDWPREAAQARILSFEKDRVKLDLGSEYLVPPLRVGLRLYRLDEERYSKPFGFEAAGAVDESGEVTLLPQEKDFQFELPSTVRGDLFLIDRSGREVQLDLVEAK